MPLVGPQAVGLAAWWPLIGHKGNVRNILTGAVPTTISELNWGTTDAELGISPRLLTGGAWIDLGVQSVLNSGPFTISLWFRCTDMSARRVLFGNNATSGARQIALTWQTTNRLTIGEEGLAFIATNPTNLTTNRLYHAAWTRSGSSHRLYLDGMEVATGTRTLGTWTGTNKLGNASSATSFSAHADVRLYSRALPPDEIWALYDPSTRWSLYARPRRLWLDVVVGEAGGFQAAWARGANQVLQPGVQ